MKQKAFFIIFEGLSLKQMNKNFLGGESPTLILETLESFSKCSIIAERE